MVDQPEVGFFLTKLVKGGPWVAARIDQNEEGWWFCTVDGVQYGASADPVTAPKLITIWTYGVRSTLEEYEYKLKLKQYHTDKGTDHPAAHPEKTIRLDQMKPLF